MINVFVGESGGRALLCCPYFSVLFDFFALYNKQMYHCIIVNTCYH